MGKSLYAVTRPRASGQSAIFDLVSALAVSFSSYEQLSSYKCNCFRLVIPYYCEQDKAWHDHHGSGGLAGDQKDF